jgi:hypothetical protein
LPQVALGGSLLRDRNEMFEAPKLGAWMPSVPTSHVVGGRQRYSRSGCAPTQADTRGVGSANWPSSKRGCTKVSDCSIRSAYLDPQPSHMKGEYQNRVRSAFAGDAVGATWTTQHVPGPTFKLVFRVITRPVVQSEFRAKS